jgi:hypothetical protein
MQRGKEQTVWNRTLSFTGALSGNIGSWISLTATGPIAATSTAIPCEPALDWRLLPGNSRFKASNSIGCVGVCWGEDLLWEENRWECRRFNGKKWRVLPSLGSRKRSYQLNGYRVLLTRARQNMILYVPKPNSSDLTRPHVWRGTVCVRSTSSASGIPHVYD